MRIAYYILGLFLSGIFLASFLRSWRCEQDPKGTISFSQGGKRTSVLVGGTFLMWALFVFFILAPIAYGVKEGFWEFFDFLSQVLIMICIVQLVLLPILPLLRKHISARACALCWLMPVFAFYNLAIIINYPPKPKLLIYVPRSICMWIFLIWAVGFVIVFGGSCIRHFLFEKKIRECAVSVEDEEVLALFEEIKDSLDYHYPVKLIISHAANAPFSMGKTNTKRCTVLPKKDGGELLGYSKEALSMIFLHELHHLQREDVDTKVFLAFCRGLCWFNPLAWCAFERASEDLELSCDEIVTKDFTEGSKVRYAALILSEAASSEGFTTCLSAAANTLRYRMKRIVKDRPKRLGAAVPAILLMLCVFFYGSIGISYERKSIRELWKESGSIESIGFTDSEIQYTQVDQDKEEELLSFFGDIEATRLPGSTNYIGNGIGAEIYVKGKNGFIGFEEGEYLKVRIYGERWTRNYRLESPLDWQALNAIVHKQN